MILYLVGAAYVLINMAYQLINEEGIESSENLVSFLIGLLQGSGLLLSGVLRPSIIIGFLTLDSTVWNPALFILTLTVTAVNTLVFMLIVGKP